MKTSKTMATRNAVLTALLGLLVAGSALANDTPLPSVQRDGDIEYLSGGTARDEARAILHAHKEWPLMLQFDVKNVKRIDFSANVHVQVRDGKNATALQATAQGPLMLARLKPGHYTVDATLDGKTLHRKIDIGSGDDARVVFTWPAGTAHTRS